MFDSQDFDAVRRGLQHAKQRNARAERKFNEIAAIESHPRRGKCRDEVIYNPQKYSQRASYAIATVTSALMRSSKLAPEEILILNVCIFILYFDEARMLPARLTCPFQTPSPIGLGKD